MDKPEIEHSKYWYDYTRNDPNAKNPFIPEPLEDDGLDYEVDYMSSSADYMADVDDQYAHYFTEYQIADRMDYEPKHAHYYNCLLYTSPSPRDLSTSRMPSSA